MTLELAKKMFSTKSTQIMRLLITSHFGLTNEVCTSLFGNRQIHTQNDYRNPAVHARAVRGGTARAAGAPCLTFDL